MKISIISTTYPNNLCYISVTDEAKIGNTAARRQRMFEKQISEPFYGDRNLMNLA